VVEVKQGAVPVVGWAVEKLCSIAPLGLELFRACAQR